MWHLEKLKKLECLLNYLTNNFKTMILVFNIALGGRQGPDQPEKKELETGTIHTLLS